MSVSDGSTGFVESSRLWGYGIAVLSVVAAVAVRLALDPLLGTGQVLFAFTLAVMAAARIGGRGPGLVASALSVPLAWYFFIEPRFSFAIANPVDVGSLVVLAGAGAGISLLIGRPPLSANPGSDKQSDSSFLRRAILFGSSLLVLVVLTRVLYADFAREKDRQQWVTHSYQVLNAIRALMSNLQDAETGQRGYLLTCEESYRAPFLAAVREEQSARQTLRQLTAGDPAQQAKLDSIDRLVAAKFSELQTTMAVRQNEGLDAALAVVRRGEGKRIMDECRVVLGAMEEEDRRLLATRTRAADTQDMRMRWVMGLGTGSLLMLLVIAAAVIERDSRSRERARHAVTLSEERLRLALDAANAGTWEWDLETNENVWSEELWKMYGLEPHSRAPSYDAWREAMHPDDRANAEQVVALAARTGTELNAEYRVRDRDGTERWLLARGRPLRDGEGSPARFIGIVLDITGRKRAEEALRAREQDLRHFAEFAPVAIAMFDREMRYLAASRRFRDDYALGDQELVGRSHYDVFPEIGENWREIHRRCLSGAVERHPGEPFLRSDGAEQWVRWEIQPWHRTDGSIGGIVLFSEDNTPQKRAEQALRESEARLRLAQQVARVGTFEFNFQTGVDTWTPELEAIYGFEAGGFDGTRQSWESLIHPEDRPEAVRKVRQAMSTGKFEAEWRVVWPDGTLRWLTARAWAFQDEAGKPARLIGVNMDITESKQAELEIRRLNSQLEQRVRQRTAQLETANHELEAFAYSVSHDLRAPLRGIDGWSLALAEDYAGQLDEQAQRYISRVRSETQRMGLLIDDMLQLSRVARAEMHFVPVDLTGAAQGIAARLKESNPGRQIEFVIEPGLTGTGDARLLEIALTNLLANAVKFTGPCASAHIEVGQTGQNGRTAFYVRDNGVGFDMLYADKLFRPFQRLHKSSEFPGTGIGLATVQRVIHRHAGRVRAEAQVDGGATFYFTIGETA